MSVPIAIPVMAGRPTRGISGTRPRAQAIVATLNIAGASAGMKKRRTELSMPLNATDAATVIRKGSRSRVSCVVSSSFPGVSANRGAIARVIGWAKAIPITTAAPVTTSSALMT